MYVCGMIANDPQSCVNNDPQMICIHCTLCFIHYTSLCVSMFDVGTRVVCSKRYLGVVVVRMPSEPNIGVY